MTFLVTDYVRNKRAERILKILDAERQFIKDTNSKKKLKILDVGCGDMKLTNIIRKEGYDIIGIDIHDGDATWHVKPDIVMDATNMTFSNDNFDIVIAVETLEHVPCLDEIKRVLKKNGVLIATTPAKGSDWMRNILVKLRLLEAQDFYGGHDYFVDLKDIGMHIDVYDVMFMGASQFGVLTHKWKK